MSKDGSAQAANDFVSCMSRTLRAANRYLAERLQEAGLDALASSHGDILAQLFVCEPLSMQDLARSIHRDPSTVTALVKKLAAAGYVETGKSPDDGRVIQVTLTAEGRALQPVFDRISADLVQVQMQGVDPRDLEVARQTLELIEGNFSEALATRGHTKGGLE